jgi:hypothetical protein
MLVGVYEFNCSFESGAILPEFKGSTLRGGLGRSLKRIACALHRQKCGDCLLVETCAYTFLFETKEGIPVPGDAQRIPYRPHPYALVPPDTIKKEYNAGDKFSFSIILFGKANEFLPHILYAVQETGREGLGKKSQANGRFRVDHVRNGNEFIYEEGRLKTNTQLLDLAVGPYPADEIKEIMLSCKTPLRLKSGNHLQDGLPFHLLIRAALRRISSLEATYGDGEPLLDYKGLAARAADVHTVQTDCCWIDIERYSSRQKTAMLIGGIKGSLTYQGGNLAEFLPLLRYCEVTHLGKQTTFGLGRIQVAWE